MFDFSLSQLVLIFYETEDTLNHGQPHPLYNATDLNELQETGLLQIHHQHWHTYAKRMLTESQGFPIEIEHYTLHKHNVIS